jgi:hypothetical protein
MKKKLFLGVAMLLICNPSKAIKPGSDFYTELLIPLIIIFTGIVSYCIWRIARKIFKIFVEKKQ